VAERPQEITQAGERRLARIESLRALAALGVLTGHAWGTAHAYGASAQDTFFARMIFGTAFGAYMLLALSGYLLFWPFVRHYWGGGAPMDLRQYAFNRALRVLPLYTIAISLLLILQEGGGSTGQWLKFMTFTANFFHDTVITVDGPLWTVVMEVHFYIVLPFLSAGLAFASRGSAARAAFGLLLLAAASLGLWFWKVTPQDVMWRHNLPANFFFVAAGMLTAFIRLGAERQRPGWLEGRLASADLWLIASLPIWLLAFYRFNLAPLITIASFLTIGACVLPLRQGPVARALDWQPIAVIGVASYSLYTWHVPILENLSEWSKFPGGVIPMFAIAAPLAIVAGLVSYRAIEAPFLGLRKRWSTASAPVRDRTSPQPAAAPSEA
jgi:peptidoglycan/LPS O-acetylase OafA/YrhL